MKNVYFFLATFFCTYACSSSGFDIDFEETKRLIKKDSVLLALDAKTSFEFQNVRYYSNDTLEWLIVLNQNINGLNIYDLTSEKLASQFSMPETGPKAIPSLNGMTFLSPDSIFLYSKMTLFSIKIVDYKGNLLSGIKVPVPEIELDFDQLPILNHQSNTYSPTVKLNNKLYFTRWPLFDFSRPDNINDDYPLELSLDLNSLTIETLPVHFPKWMQNKGWNMMYLLNGKTVSSGGDFVYNFQGDDSIQVHHSNGSRKTYYAGLSGAKFNKEPVSSNAQATRMVEEAMTTTIYWGLIYDPYRNVYYRIADRPVKFKPEHRTLLATYDKPISIIILDPEFQKVGEIDLKPNTYLFYGIFVGKKGLYIPRLNPKYKDFSEDRITYSIYELQTLNEN